MAIDIRFLNQLPTPFIDQNEFCRTLREVDTNHNGEITTAEIRANLQFHGVQNPAELDLVTLRSEQRISEASDRVRRAIQDGRVSVGSGIFQQRNLVQPNPQQSRTPTSAELDSPLDANHDNTIDSSEILSHLNDSRRPPLDLLADRLRRTSAGLYEMENHPERRGIHNLLHYASYVPFHIFHPIDGVRNLFSDGHTTDYSWRRLVIEAANGRDFQRGQAINHFMHDLRAHPEHSIQDALAQLSENEATILIDDLQVQNWQYVLTATSTEEIINAHLRMAEYLMQGSYSTYSLGGAATIAEILTTPLKAENFQMAQEILQTLENPDLHLTAQQQAQLRALREQSRTTNLGGVIDLPRPGSLNEFFDFTVSTVAELVLLRGALKFAKAGRIALGAALATHGAWGARAAVFLGHAAAAVETTAEAQQALPGIFRRGISFLGRGLGVFLQGASVAAGSLALNHTVTPPGSHNPHNSFDFELQTPLDNDWLRANLAGIAISTYEAENP